MTAQPVNFNAKLALIHDHWKPRVVEHKPCAEREVRMMLIEPRGVVNTGTVDSDRRAENDVWI